MSFIKLLQAFAFAIVFLVGQQPSGSVSCTNITQKAFGDIKDGLIAAFGDFNSDELTDIFIIRNNFKTLEILLAADTEPILRPGPKCDFKKFEITSVVPGDFDGDAIMDVLITVRENRNDKNLKVFVNWGGSDYLNCTNEDTDEPLLISEGEPVAIDFNKDMIIDLYGINAGSESSSFKQQDRTFWIFGNERKKPMPIRQSAPMGLTSFNSTLAIPHSHSYIDLNNDFEADLFLQTLDGFEVWYGNPGRDQVDFKYGRKISLDIIGNPQFHIGQTIFMDLELSGSQTPLIPIWFSKDNSSILVYEDNKYRDLHINFKDPENVVWGFIKPEDSENYDYYLRTITIRAGDYNMDGYPDLIVTLKQVNYPNKIRTFLMENVPCSLCIKPSHRTFEVKWDALSPMANDTVTGAFYDFYQDGILDVVLIERKNGQYRPLAFKNSLDYDSNFVKVIVLTGLENKKDSVAVTPLGRKKRTYGTNLPGPRIDYMTITQDGDTQRGTSAQLPQSAYFALQLPYTIFGLGRTPNFVDSLTVGISNQSRVLTQIIPNSQMIVVPRPIFDPQRWRAQLFVTPSKLILKSVLALSGTCIVITIVILCLYIKEKREDKLEKLQEAHRFHFDAM